MTGPAPLVLVVEDEPQMRRFLRASLGSHGYRVIEAATVQEAMLRESADLPDLVLLDLGLPDGDGIGLTLAIRRRRQVPILVISARGREDDKVSALDAGADDYLTKPFGVNELLARMRVAERHALRTAESGEAGSDAGLVFEREDLRIDLFRREVTLDGTAVRLTPIEYKLLALLARNAGRVLTHNQILQEVWAGARGAHSHHVRVHMAELRKKIERDPARPRLLVTEPGVGYRLQDRAEERANDPPPRRG